MQLSAGSITQTFTRNRGQTFSDGSNTNAASSSSSTSTSGNTSTNGSTSGSTNGSSVASDSTYVTGLADPATGVASTFNPTTGTVGGLPTSIPTVTTNANFTPAVPGTPTVFDVNGNVISPETPGTPAKADALNTFTGSSNNGTTASTNNSISNTLTNGLANTASSAVNQLMGIANTGGTSRVASAVFSASDFSIILSALKTQNNTKIISNPTVVTLNNTEAILNIGQEFPIPSYTYNTERGTFEVSGFQYKPIGIILKVTPQVNARGVIKLTLEPEVSQANGSTSFGGAGGASIPIIATRKAKTQVSLKDGDTMGIGGLITSSQDHGGTKVPVLGSIPVLGRLFSSKNVNDAVTNLLIFITAKTVSAEGATIEEIFDPRAVRSLNMSRDDLPGYRAPKGTDLFSEPTSAAKK
jgi:type IV pilus assembly protein PilQ